MATQQDADIYGFETPDVAYGNDTFVISHDNQSYGAGASMAINGLHTFEEMSRNDPSIVSALTNVSQWQEMQQASQGRLPFRPLMPATLDTIIGNSGSTFRSDNMSLGGSFDSMNTSFGGSASSTYGSVSTSFNGTENMQPLKIDTSVAASTPPMSILSTPVDATQYEIVPDTEWVWSSTDYASSSHSSVRTESTGPRTPLSPHTAETSQSSYFSTGYQGSPSLAAISKMDGTGSDMFPSTVPRDLAYCPCADCNVPMAPHQMASSWSLNQSHTSFSGSLPRYSSSAPSATGLPVNFFNPSQTGPAPFVPRQVSPPSTSSLMDLERQSSETTTEEDFDDSGSESDEPNVNDQAVNDATHRQKRDSFLLSMRRQNYSYKDIKELGNFREAESTLRGRVRVLTKDKSERVRKPEWDSNDVRLRCRLSIYVPAFVLITADHLLTL